MLSESIRPSSDCAQWVVDEIKLLEQEIEDLKRTVIERDFQVSELRRINKENNEWGQRLHNALKPFAGLFLYPDDFGEYTAKEVRSDEDWNEEKSDETNEEVFVLRKWIKEARKVMGEE